ncbi:MULTISPECIES: SDR family oxidoreductase [Pantoea]|uniref:NAD-dependent dehydratase n=1 Tax=Pantoea stewartii TaxID=66269 RepID=A0AB34V9I0_9GAMM|nr:MULTISPECIES: SDR family oxidoreductase [Pantoea]KTS71277.1 NAD-dependent dehydratase [Pantoea stewartii]KTS94240.1 NAD-dependent dehydratase [Pantoea stewartii]KTT05449.1 NAD-dependent dehydratase [Pantoea stewartii]PXV78273.1 nucleoside-diphosphate-sugar epimerase [Pantoea sp. PNA 03-3]
MRLFLTGATGFIGSAIAADLIAAGHEVVGLTRHQQGVDRLSKAGVEPFWGDINDHNSLQRGAASCEGVIHTAFNHDFSTFLTNCEADRQAIAAMATALAGSARPLIITSAVGLGSPGQGKPAVEDYFNPLHPNPRRASELAAIVALEKGVNVSVVRLSQVHNPLKQGLVTSLIEVARQTGVSAFIDEGQNRWSAVHLDDTVCLYRLALEKNRPGSRYHAVAEEGITLRVLADALGRILNLPVISLSAAEATDHFGWLSHFVAQDMSASGRLTRAQLGWQPTGPGLIADLERMPG